MAVTLKYALVFTLLWQSSLSADNIDFTCTEDFCLNYEVTDKCSVPDLVKCYNETLSILLPSPTVCSCCQTCLIFQNKGDSCIVGSPGTSLPNQLCGPGLTCSNKICIDMDPNTADPLQKDDNWECTDGNCTCIEKTINGNIPIFGSFLENSTVKGERQCACSVLAQKAREQPIRPFPFKDIYQLFARCLPTGQFDPLQCSDGICSCVDPGTGTYDDTAPRVSITALGNGSPVCYNQTAYDHSTDYYHDCEKALIGLQRARDLVEAEDYQFLFPFKFECRPDGEFAEAPTEELQAALRALESSISEGFIHLE